MADDRATLEKVAAGFHELEACRRKQRATMALMIRACVQRLKTNTSTARKEATDGLTDLAEMLEKDSG